MFKIFLWSVIAVTIVYGFQCKIPDSVVINATGSISVPGIQAPGSSEAGGIWTYETIVSVVPEETTPYVDQYFNLKASPPFDLVSGSLPFHGCTAAYHSLSVALTSRAQQDDGDCKELFSPDCVSALIAQANQTAISFSGTNITPECDNILTSVPPECKKFANFGTNWGLVSANCE
jgi:hypothetical protein